MTRLPENLAAVIADVRDRWSLEIGDPFEPGGTCSWVAPARFGSADVVLKVGWPHPEAEHEAAGLAFWNGDGTIRLLDAVRIDGTPAMLLERCSPGVQLSRLVDPDGQDLIIAELLRRLWRAPAPGHEFRPLTQMCNDWAEHARRRVAISPPADVELVRVGCDLFRRLAAAASREVVLFTDLHAGNVLSAAREPWLAIDPKPYVGDPAYDALQHMLNVPRLRTDPAGLSDRMSHLLGVNSERLRSWLFARCAVGSVDEPELADVARRLAP
jgi:streptomycin 6-kinase